MLIFCTVFGISKIFVQSQVHLCSFRQTSSTNADCILLSLVLLVCVFKHFEWLGLQYITNNNE